MEIEDDEKRTGVKEDVRSADSAGSTDSTTEEDDVKRTGVKEDVRSGDSGGTTIGATEEEDTKRTGVKVDVRSGSQQTDTADERDQLRDGSKPQLTRRPVLTPCG